MNFIKNEKITFYVSLILQLFFVGKCLIYIYNSFEKTQAPEISYFLVFLIGFLLQSVHLLIPILNITNSNSTIFNFLARTIFIGHFFCYTSFGLIALFSEDKQLHLIDRNYSILLFLSLVFTIIIPINTNITDSIEYFPNFGFSKTLIFYKIILTLFSFISFFVLGKNKTMYPHSIIAFTFLSIIIGSEMLFGLYNFIFVIIGITLIFIGSYFFLHRLHKYYLWR